MHPKKNQSDVYQRLVDAIAQNNAIALVGAGSSKRVGYPSWNRLLEILSDKAAEIDPSRKGSLDSLRKIDPLICADKIKKILGVEQYYFNLKKIFGPEKPKFDNFHKLLVSLPFKHFLTTNYDRILQVAHEECRKTRYVELNLEDHQKYGNLFDSIDKKIAQRHFIHIHGSIRNPQSILLANEDYDERYTKRNDFVELLKQFFSGSLVFLGFSLEDEEFMRPLKYLTACLGKGDVKHHAILPKPERSEDAEATIISCRSKYRIEPLFYDSINNHEQLFLLLEELKKDVENRSKELVVEDVKFVVTSLKDNSEFSDIVQPMQEAKNLIELRLNSNQIDTTIPDSHTRTKLDSEIDAIFNYVKNRQPEIAIEMYKSIIDREGEDLDKRLKYRLHANIGNALNAMGKSKEASKEYLLATNYWDESKEALALKALGHILNNNFGKSLKISEQICAEHSDYPRGHALRLQSLPKNYPFKEARKSVPLKLRRDSEVAFALGGIAHEQGLSKRSEIYSRIAWKGSPDWIEAGIAYTAELILIEKERAYISGGTKFIPQNKKRLEEAESILTELLDKLGEYDPAKRKGVIFHNRASTRRLLGRESEARSDIEEAFYYNRNDPEIVAAYALQQERDAGLNEAIRILHECKETQNHSGLSFLLSSMLFQRSNIGDLDNAIEILMPWCKKIEEVTFVNYRYEFLRLASELLRKIGKTEDAIKLLDQTPESSLPPNYRQLLLLWIKIESNVIDPKEAVSTCEKISDALTSNGDYFIKREVALCADKIRHYHLSFNLWRNITYPNDYNSDTQFLLNSAKEIKEYKFIIEFCRQLRQKGIRERNCYIHEIEANRECHEFKEVLNLMAEWLKLEPDDKEMRMNLSLMAYEIGEEQYVEKNPDKLPAIENVLNAEYGTRVVQALSQSENIQAAIIFAYELWKKFPDDMVARHKLISMIMDKGQGVPILRKPEEVELGSAVIYKTTDLAETRIHIIEDGPSPSMARNEYSPNHEISKLLLKKKVGDSIFINGREWSILEINNKYTYMTLNLMKKFDMDFPDNPLLRQFQIPSKTDSGEIDPQEALKDVKAFMQGEKDHLKTVEDLYTKGTLPVVTFAKCMGKSVLETMMYLAASANHKILVCPSASNELNSALQLLTKECKVVLDETAIATLFMLGIYKDLKQLPFKLIVPESILLELRRIIKQAISNKRSELFLGISNDKLVVQKVSPTEHANWINSLEDLFVSINENCSIEGGKSLLEFDATSRDNMINILGPRTADSIAIAKKNEALYWTDDLLSGAIARELKVNNIWSQVALMYMVNMDRKFIPIYDKAEKNLFLWRYDFIIVMIKTIISIYHDAKWNLKDLRLKYVEEFIGRVGGINKINCGVTCLLLIKIWHSAPNRKKACEIIIKLLEKIGRAVSGPKIAKVIYKSQYKIFKPSIFPKIGSLKHMLRSWRMNSLKLD